MVAKSYQSMEIVSDIIKSNGKAYITVRNDKGKDKIVRWYTEAEYRRMYPEDKPVAARPYGPQKEVLGFERGYITIFKGGMDEEHDWLRLSPARYCRWWGWYFISSEPLPIDLPSDLIPVELPWELVGNEDGYLKTDAEVSKAVDSVLYEESPSEFQGSVGQRLDLHLTVTNVYQGDNYYGHYTIHTFEDKDGNVYVWTTNAKSWKIGEVKHIRGTVKEHKTFKNVKQTILTRCSEVK